MQIRSVQKLRPRRAVIAFFAVLATTCAFTGAAQADPTADVIGGTNVTHSQYTTSFPFMVGVLADENPTHEFCGGSLIAAQWVMTAAHCYEPSEGLVPRFVRIGSEDMLGITQIIPVTANIIHPSWNPDLLANDIQLLKLAYAPTPATPIARSTFAEDPVGGEAATLIGWGRTVSGGSGSASQILKYASVDVVSQNNCEQEWFDIEGQDVINSGQICAIHYGTPSNPRMACNGDSGGPLLYNNKVIGIASFVYVGCYDDATNVYTRVSSYNSWIDSVRAKSFASASSSVDFGSVDVTSGTAERTISFRSDGDQAVNVGAGTTSGDYTVKSSTCVGPIASGASCSVVISFDPTNTGTRGGEFSASTDSIGSAVTRVSLVGLGTGKATTPIKLKLTLPHAAKVKGKYLTAKFKVAYAFPTGAASPAVCTGLVKLSLKVPKLKKPVFKTGVMSWTVKGCAVTITTRMAKRAKGKKAKATVVFAGNNTAAATTLKSTIKLR